MSRHIPEDVERRLYAESMGRCMNPACKNELFRVKGDVIEKAHIDPFCKTADNTYENLVVLCPTCHTDFDKNNAFTPEIILEWKNIRKDELNRFFNIKYDTFDELRKVVAPILEENKTIFKNYYLNKNKTLWDMLEPKILSNNRQLKMLFSSNLDLIQSHENKEYSNLEQIRLFMVHVEEFELTRTNEEKNREILFPQEINSMFGVEPVIDSFIASTESLETLIERLKEEEKFRYLAIDIDNPYFQMVEDGKLVCVYLKDCPRLRQLYHDYKCFRRTNVRLDGINFVLKYIRSREIEYSFLSETNLREISINNTKMIFVYEYCLSEAFLEALCPDKNSVIVNLHKWNGDSCISKQAYELAKNMNIKLLTIKDFYRYINEIK